MKKRMRWLAKQCEKQYNELHELKGTMKVQCLQSDWLERSYEALENDS